MDSFLRWYINSALLLILIALFVLIFNSLGFVNNFVLFTFSGTAFLHAFVLKALSQSTYFSFLAKKVFFIFLSFPIIIHLIALFNAEVFASSYPLYFGGLLMQFWFLTVSKNKLIENKMANSTDRLILFLFSLFYTLLILLIWINPVDILFYELANYAFLPIILLGSWLILRD
jgi:hypothetical protein